MFDYCSMSSSQLAQDLGAPPSWSFSLALQMEASIQLIGVWMSIPMDRQAVQSGRLCSHRDCSELQMFWPSAGPGPLSSLWSLGGLARKRSRCGLEVDFQATFYAGTFQHL